MGSLLIFEEVLERYSGLDQEWWVGGSPALICGALLHVVARRIARFGECPVVGRELLTGTLAGYVSLIVNWFRWGFQYSFSCKHDTEMGRDLCTQCLT